MNADGYLIISIDGRNAFVHQLVAKAFIPNPENKPFVNHIDNDRTNPKVTNLEWCTAKENVAHMDRQGRRGFAVGEAARERSLHIKESLGNQIYCIENDSHYSSKSEAVNDTGISYESINKSIDRCLTVNGHTFVLESWLSNITDIQSYLTVAAERTKLYQSDSYALRSHRIGVPVLCVETGQTYMNISEAAKDMHLNADFISKAIRGNRVYKGYHWQAVVA
jgi:hypothetical protein